MAEERALASARALERSEDLSKEDLQRRMEEARDSISNTVTEIKENVAHQVQTVKETLDWREQYRRRPLAWSLGAMGAGFVIGYKIAGAFKDDEEPGYPSSGGYAYAAQPILSQPGLSQSRSSILETEPRATRANGQDEGPGLFERFRETPAYDKLRSEVGSLGNRVVEELSTAAQTLVLPLLMGKIKQLIGVDPAKGGSIQRDSHSDPAQPSEDPVRYQRYERPS